MRSFLLLVVLATASQAYMVPQNAPCSGSTVCLLNCVVDSRCPVFNLAKPTFLAGTSCTRFFKCESGRACEMECPVGLHFNLAKEACDWPHQACCDPSIECRPDPCRPGSGCDTPIVPVPPVPQPPTYPQPPIPVPPCSGGSICLLNCVVDSRCPAFNPAKPLLLPGRSCDRFYKCESGRACEMQCPSGTHFNQKEQTCDWPHQACCDPSIECRPDPCRPGSGCDTPVVPPVTQPPVQPIPPVVVPPCSGGSICLLNCVVDSRCPAFNPAKPLLLPGRSCDRFYKCESGRACEMQCPSGTHFNQKEQTCDWPHQACCDPSIECRPDPCRPGSGCDSPGVPPVTPPPTYPTPPAPCSGGGICALNCPLDNRCPAFNGKKPLLLPGQSCDRYLKCESGRACPMNCPAGLHFNQREQICDWPFQACCDPRIECRPNPCPPGAFGCSQNNNNNYNNNYNNNWQQWG